MERKVKAEANYIFINPNDNKDIEKVLHEIIINKLLDKKFEFQKNDG